WRTDSGFVRRVCLQHDRRSLQCPDFLRACLVRLFSESLQPHSGRNAGRWANRDRALAMALAAGICGTALVRLEISELHRVVTGNCLLTTNYFAVSKTHRDRTAV